MDESDRTQTPETAEYGWMGILARVSPVGIYHGDEFENCKYVNERWCELTGLTFSEALGSGWERAIHPEDSARIHEEWKRVAEAGEPVRSEHRCPQCASRAGNVQFARRTARGFMKSGSGGQKPASRSGRSTAIGSPMAGRSG